MLKCFCHSLFNPIFENILNQISNHSNTKNISQWRRSIMVKVVMVMTGIVMNRSSRLVFLNRNIRHNSLRLYSLSQFRLILIPRPHHVFTKLIFAFTISSTFSESALTIKVDISTNQNGNNTECNKDKESIHDYSSTTISWLKEPAAARNTGVPVETPFLYAIRRIL